MCPTAYSPVGWLVDWLVACSLVSEKEGLPQERWSFFLCVFLFWVGGVGGGDFGGDWGEKPFYLWTASFDVAWLLRENPEVNC